MRIKILRRLILGFILSILIFFSHPQFIFADPLGNWSSTTNLPVNNASHASTFEGGKVFLFGGANVDDFSDVLSSPPNIDGTLSGWTLVSNVPKTRYFGSLVKKENRVYIIGGATFPGFQIIENNVYSATIDDAGAVSSWGELTPLPANRAVGGAVIVGSRIYYAGGFDNSSTAQDEIYYADINPDGTLGAWTTSLVSLPEPLYGFGMIEHENNIIIFGGQTTGGITRDKVYKASVDLVDGSLSVFVETSALPEAVYRSAYVKVGLTIISAGGYNGFAHLDKVYYANINPDGTLDSWQQSANNLPQALQAAAASYANGFMYVTGGFNGAYLDTVYYAPVNIVDLPVPYYSQNNGVIGGGPWGDEEYDHAQSIGLSPITMDSWGCAVTSAAMVLNYHGMTELEDDTPIDPGSLNDWLKNNNGYSTGGSGVNAYSSIVWPTIGELTQRLFDAGKAKYKLTAIAFSAHDKLTEDLVIREIAGEMVGAPPIVKVTKASITDSHYVVPKGFTDTSIAVNDPEWNYLDLTNFDNNDYTDLHRYIPSETDLSYLYFVVNPNVELLITDSQGRKSGKIVENGNTASYSEIPEAVYVYESPISNPDDDGNPINLGTGANIFSLPKPSEGEYHIALSSGENTNYTLNVHTFEEDGSQTHHKIEEFVGPGASDEFDLNYSQDDPSSLVEVVTFDSLIADINSLYNLGEINFSNRVLLLTQAKIAKKLASNNLTKKVSVKILKAMRKAIVKQKGRGVSENAYNILNADIQSLIAILSP